MFRVPDVTRTITDEDDPHVSAHGGYQLPKITTNSGLVMRSRSTNSLVEIQIQRQTCCAMFPSFVPVRACRVGLSKLRNDSRQRTAAF